MARSSSLVLLSLLGGALGAVPIPCPLTTSLKWNIDACKNETTRADDPCGCVASAKITAADYPDKCDCIDDLTTCVDVPGAAEKGGILAFWTQCTTGPAPSTAAAAPTAAAVPTAATAPTAATPPTATTAPTAAIAPTATISPTGTTAPPAATAPDRTCDISPLSLYTGILTSKSECAALAPVLLQPTKQKVDGLDVCPCVLALDTDADAAARAAADAIKTLDCTLAGVEMRPKVTDCTNAPTTPTAVPTAATRAPSRRPTANGETKSPATQSPSKAPTVPKRVCTEAEKGLLQTAGIGLLGVVSPVTACKDLVSILSKLLLAPNAAAVEKVLAFDFCPCLLGARSKDQAKLDEAVAAVPDCALVIDYKDSNDQNQATNVDLRNILSTVCEAPSAAASSPSTARASTPSTAGAAAASPSAANPAANPAAASPSAVSGAPTLAAGLALALAPLALLCR